MRLPSRSLSRFSVACSIESLEHRQLLAATVSDREPDVSPDPLLIAAKSVLADMDGDGRADQITVSRSNSLGGVQIMLTLGTGLGSFRFGDVVTVNFNTGVAVAVGDLNGDGAADVAIAGRNPLSASPSNLGTSIVTFLGDGHGKFKRTPASTNATGGAPITITTFVSQVSDPTGLVVADLDHSGFGDIAVLGAVRDTGSNSTPPSVAAAVPGVVVNWDPTLPTFAPVAPTIVPLGAIQGVNLLFNGDLNHDGRVDLVATRSAPLPPSLLAVVRPDLATIAFPTSRDAAVALSMNPLYVGTVSSPSPTAASAAVTTLGLANVDGGADLELVGRVGNATIRYSSYRPAASAGSAAGFRPVQTAKSIGLPAGVALGRIQSGDINGDGLSDLLADSQAGRYLGRNITNTVDSLGVTFSWSKVPLTPGAPGPTGSDDGAISKVSRDVLA